MNQELIEKARQAGSPEEIMKIAEENDIEMCKEEAENIYKQLHTSGELSDEELEGAAGGCKGAGGKTIVTSGCRCFTGQYEKIKPNSRPVDFLGDLWSMWSCDFNGEKVCGSCIHLELKSGIGYCGVSG